MPLLGPRYPHQDRTVEPVELVLGEEVVGGYSQRYVAPPCGYFDVSLAEAVGNGDEDLEKAGSQEEKAELVVELEVAVAAAGCRRRYLKMLGGHEQGQLLPLPFQGDEL